MKINHILLILSLVLFSTLKSVACSCGDLKSISDTEYNNAAEIFIGEVINVVEDRTNWQKEVTLKVAKSFKSSSSESEITIYTPLDGAACGLKINNGQKWYIFAYNNSKNQLVAGLCGRSVNLRKKFSFKNYGIKQALKERQSWKKDKKHFRRDKRFINKIKKTHANNS